MRSLTSVFSSISKLSLLCLLLSQLGWSLSVSAADAKATEKQIRQLQSEIKTLEKQLKHFKGESQTVEASIRRSEIAAGKFSQAIRVNQKKMATVDRQLSELGEEQQRLEQAKVVQAEVLAQQLAAAYRIGRQDQLKLLLNQQHPERISRLLQYYQYLNRSRVEAIAIFQQTLDSLADVERNIDQQQQQLKSERAELKNNSEQLDQSRRQRVQALKQLRGEIKGTDKRLGRLKQDRKRLQQVLKQLQQTLKKIDLAWQSKEFRQLKGKLSWPTKGRVIQGFGSRAVQGIKNEGMLIKAPMGRNVRAVHHGRVVFSDWIRGFGLLIIVDHGSGYMSLYGHNQSLLKEVGDWVSANETIATVGDSGGLDQPGLYFAIRY
ncbi:MAG: peptidoglycan DD-metalloendopeptidase family protein, partial [Motiliproteus sp.]|nr:peptidoglycan DD-metalloendopeptidase family protein [Motiliproteus sp.]